MSNKICITKYIEQNMYKKYVEQSLYSKVFRTKFVQQSISNKVCRTKYVEQSLPDIVGHSKLFSDKLVSAPFTKTHFSTTSPQIEFQLKG
jgi:hypothetical protein